MSDAANSTFVSLIDVDEFVVLHDFDNVIDFMDHHCGKDCRIANPMVLNCV